MAHAQREFFDVHGTIKPAAAREALDRIGELYKIEHDIRGRTPEQRLRARSERTAPLMTELHDWLEATRSQISGRSDLAPALRYALSRWDAPTLILRDGRACIDNSAGERAMRPIAVGRRNWTFAGSDSGGERAAAIYSLIETSKLNGLNPECTCGACLSASSITWSTTSPSCCRGTCTISAPGSSSALLHDSQNETPS